MQVVGVVGPKRSGKDTLAKYLVQHCYHCHAKSRAFADELRLEAAAGFGLRDLSLFLSEHLKEVPTESLALKYCRHHEFIKAMSGSHIASMAAPNTPRRILQLWGTEFRRRQRDAYWIEKAHRYTLEFLRDGVKFLIFTDVRFLNEANYIRSMGGVLVRMSRRDTEPTEFSHVSEWENSLIPCNEAVRNDGTLEALEEQATLLMAALVAGKVR